MTITWSLFLINVNSWTYENQMKMRYLPIIKSDLKTTTTKKLLSITIEEHLNFIKHLTNICKRASRKLNALSRALLFLAINRKR